GLPLPGSQTSPADRSSRGGGGGLWSMTHAAAIGAPTRVSITRTTSSTRRRPAKASTRSPTATGVAGFAVEPLTLTCPPRHASVARERVRYRRTAHSHRSTRVCSTPPSSHAGRIMRGGSEGARPGGERCGMVACPLGERGRPAAENLFHGGEDLGTVLAGECPGHDGVDERFGHAGGDHPGPGRLDRWLEQSQVSVEDAGKNAQLDGGGKDLRPRQRVGGVVVAALRECGGGDRSDVGRVDGRGRAEGKRDGDHVTAG